MLWIVGRKILDGHGVVDKEHIRAPPKALLAYQIILTVAHMCVAKHHTST